MGDDMNGGAKSIARLEQRALQDERQQEAVKVTDEMGRSPRGEWYVLHTRARHEKAIAARLKERSTEVFLPLHRRRKKWRNGVHAEVDFPLLPCYLFARANALGRSTFLEMQGILGFAGAETVPDEEIARLRAAIELRAEPHPEVEGGDRVRIVTGPLRGAAGILERTEQGCRVVLAYAQMHRAIAVAVGEDSIEPYETNSSSIAKVG